jgi:predicted kinase
VEPWLIFTVGPRGAGKKQAIRNLVFEGHLELLTYIDVDPDSIRRRLPEYDTYVKMSPHKVDELTRKEAGLICEILTLAGLQAGRNVIVDGGLRDSKWHLELINKLKKEYPFLKFGIFHITAPLQHIIKHSRKKAIETGHEISEISITRCINSIPNSLKILKPAVDFTCEIHNGEDECELVGHIEWEDFEQTFAQACAWKPGMHGKQKRNVSGNQSFIARQASVKISKILRKRFSVFISSEDNNAVGEMNFFGEYSHIRKTLDYSYHKNYTFERQKLQDAIINDMLDSAFILDADGKVGTVPTNPWIVFTAGAMGAGKSHVMNILVEKGRFPLRAFVIVDPDEIRRLLPEYHMYINENAELAGELTRKE